MTNTAGKSWVKSLSNKETIRFVVWTMLNPFYNLHFVTDSKLVFDREELWQPDFPNFFSPASYCRYWNSSVIKVWELHSDNYSDFDIWCMHFDIVRKSSLYQIHIYHIYDQKIHVGHVKSWLPPKCRPFSLRYCCKMSALFGTLGCNNSVRMHQIIMVLWPFFTNIRCIVGVCDWFLTKLLLFSPKVWQEILAFH